MVRRVRVVAPAKVNLTLEVLGRRDDGYHEIASVMATVDLFDDVRIGPARALDVRIHPPVDAPRGQDLASQAARTIAAACGREPALHVNVRKRIPVAAGLGGGSSDAGAVLRGVAQLWGRTDLDLVSIGAAIGSDIPFFAAGCALARIGGRGDRVVPIAPPADPMWIALVTLRARVPTAEVYAALGDVRSPGDATMEMSRLLERGSVTPAELRALTRNDLAAAAERICPAITDARAAARGKGIELAVSGSGPSLFAIADDRAHALRLARALARIGLRAHPYRLAVTS